MNLKNERRALQGIMGGIGVVCLIAGGVGFIPMPTAIVLAFSFWIIGTTVVNLFTNPGGKDPDE